jgi:pimeloyl-ACP methyl ester carboxylesterase
MRAWLYRPKARPLAGTYLLAPGLHYAGPADPRMDRFCRVLSAAGYAVLAPFLPDFLELRVRASLTDDLERCLLLLQERREWCPSGRPALFSISFGALPALRLAARTEHQRAFQRLFLFGGYANWAQTIEYCLSGRIDGRPHGVRDPLNQPVVFMNLLDQLPQRPAEPSALLAAWRRYVESTWGRPEMKAADRYQPLARRLAEELDAPVAELFLQGCGLDGDALGLCRAALDQPDIAALLDTGPVLADIRAPVTVVHGLEDDVIPYSQSEELHRRLGEHTECELHLTGLVDHTRSVAKIGAGVRELAILRDICWRLASVQ